MRRRRLLALLGGASAAQVAAWAQPPAQVPRVGFLISETLAGQASRVEALRAGLREHGHVEGSTIEIEVRSAEGRYGSLAYLAAELLRLRVAVLVAFGIKALVAARAVTTTVPIVIPATSTDLVSMGLVRSFARPGTNVTGATNFGPEVAAKRLELLKQVRPGVTRVALLVNPANAAIASALQRMNAAAGALHLVLQPFEVHAANEFDRAFGRMAKARIEAVVVQDDTLFGEANAAAVARRAREQGLLSLGSVGFAEAGGTIGFGSLEAESYRRGAYFIDRILKGASPGDLPIEQATRFELVLNLPTARAIGVTFPQPVMLRADRVIE